MEADKKPTELATLLWVTILYKNVKVWGSPSRPQACEHDIAKLLPPSCDIVLKDLPASARGTDLFGLLAHLKSVVLTKGAPDSALPCFQRCVAILTSLWVRAKEALAMPHGASAVPPDCCRSQPASASPQPSTSAPELTCGPGPIHDGNADQQASDGDEATRARLVLPLDHEQFGRGVSEADIRGWLAKDRARLNRLEATRDGHPDPELLQAEIDMVKATIGQFESELRFISLRRERRAASDG